MLTKMRLLKALYHQAVLHARPVGSKLSSSASSTDLQLQCLRYPRLDRQQRRHKCMECSFQSMNNGSPGIGSLMMQKSRMLPTNGMHTKAFVPGEESKNRLVLAPQKSRDFLDLENKRRAKIEKLPVGLTNVRKAAQDQEGLQQRSLYADARTNLHEALAVDVNDTDEDSDIFDDIFESDGASSSKNEQNKSEKCSLSDLVRRYKEAFLSVKREKEAVTGADDPEWKEERSLSRNECKSRDLDTRTKRCTSYRAERGDLFMEEEDTGMRSHWSGGGQRSAACSGMGMTQSRSYKYKAGMRGKQASGRIFYGDRPSRECSNRDDYAEAEGRVHDREKRRDKDIKARGGYAEDSGRYNLRAAGGGGFAGKRRGEGRVRW